MSILNIFSNFSISTHWHYILFAVLILVALIILIIFIRKHIALTITVIIFGGLLVGYYFGNLYFALRFSEGMTCDALRKDESEYVKYELDNVYIYQKINMDSENNIVDNSDDIFAVKKTLFVYYKSNPKKTFDELEPENGNGDVSLTVSVKAYETDEGNLYQIVPQYIKSSSNEISRSYFKSVTLVYDDGETEDRDSEQLYIFQTQKKVAGFKVNEYIYSLDPKLD